MNNNLTLVEHGFIYIKKGAGLAKQEGNNIGLPQKIFDEIETFVLRNEIEEADSVIQFLIPAYKKGFGKILKAMNYVGVLQTKKGITIEILPKIAGVVPEEGEIDAEKIRKTKDIFLKMLRTLKKSPFKISNFANLDISRMPLMDIFIIMFLEELDIIVKQGLRKDYLAQSENQFVLKGKLNFNKNIRYNLVHKERFFVEYDEFNTDRPENKLIKSTLLLLQKKTHSNSLQQRVRMFCFIFDDISESSNVDVDLLKCKSNRLTSHYDKILVWCRIFLKNKTFSNYKGNDLAFALLFPMERIFEDYVATYLKKHLDIQTQEHLGKLLLEFEKKYRMKPDIVIDKGSIIADTKWKILEEEHNMSQSDLYQMFAYGFHPGRDMENKTKKIILIYPYSDSFPKDRKYTFFDINSDNKVGKRLELEIYPFDLDDVDNNNKDILEKCGL